MENKYILTALVYVLLLYLRWCISFGATSDVLSKTNQPEAFGATVKADHGPCAQPLADISAFPGEERYKTGATIYNPTYSNLQPAFIAFPKSVEDVQRCLLCAYEHSVPLTVKSGGHSSAGYSTINGSSNGAFVINLGELNNVIVDEDSETVWVQAGARWQDVYSKIDDKKYLIVGGMCPPVGVSGYTLGGGYGVLSRYFGLAIDNTLSFTMVTANGSSVVIANASNNTDLYWSLRGGGGGNFGVVVDITFRIHPLEKISDNPIQFMYGTMMYNTSVSEQVLQAAFNLSLFHHRQLYLDILVLPTKELKISPIYLDTGDKDTDINIVLKPLMDKAYNITIGRSSYFEAVAGAVNGSTSHLNMSLHQGPLTIKGCLLGGNNFSSAASSFFKFDILETCTIAFMHLGGAVGDVSPRDTAYFHRNGAFDYFATCHYHNDKEKSLVNEFQNNLYNDLHSNGYCVGSYVNDINRDLKNWQMEYYGGNYEHLVEIKEQWNPLHKGTFHFLQEIGSSYDP